MIIYETMNIRQLILSALISGFLMPLSAQEKEVEFPELKIKKSEFKTAQEDGFREAWENLQLAEDLFSKGKGFYPEARDIYLLAHQYNSDYPLLNLRIGLCYLGTDDKYEALKYLRKAYDQSPKLHPDMNFYLARAYHLVLQFDKAIENYKVHQEYLLSSNQKEEAAKMDKFIFECESGIKLTATPLRAIISNLGDSINSPYDEYLSIFAKGDSMMIFTSRRPEKLKSKRNPYDNNYYEDIYLSELYDGTWSGARLFQRNIQTSGNDAAVGFSRKGDELYIYSGQKNGGDILVSRFNPKKQVWSSPEPMPSKFNSKQSESSIIFTFTGDTAYYISADEEFSHGGKDIFIIMKNDKGKWMDPKNLGAIVNSKYDEEGIYLTPTGNELYFSSRGHNSMGGYDIFLTTKQTDGTWSEPANLGYPVNTPDDDLFYSISLNGKAAYYSANREGGRGARDIYKVVYLGSEKELLLQNEDILLAGLDDTRKKGFLVFPEPFSLDSFYILTGKVLDAKSGDPVRAKLEFIDVENSSIAATAITSDSGTYTIKFEQNRNYGVEVVAKDYLFLLDAVDMTKAAADEPFLKDFLLEKVEVGTKVVLENIYFETSKATLKANSYTQLNQVIDFLVNNETIRLEISGHTDNVGSLKVNTKLSEERAKAVVDYLVANGVAASRLEARGYGFTQPVAPNDTPDGREKNRRVEFKVLSK
jgi:outer membrane protein OmpA-like peptidoglycan-associated protein/tetratricopeptide (TPR) repeat protein